MNIKSLFKLSLPIFLFSIFPVLDLYYHNPMMMLGEAVVLAFLPITISAICIFIASLIYRDLSKGTLFAACLLFFFYYFHVFREALSAYTMQRWGTAFLRLRYILPVFFLFFIWLFYKILKTKKISFFPFYILSIIFSVLISFLSFKIICQEYFLFTRNQAIVEQNKKFVETIIKTKTKVGPQNPPDVYFIILDMYTSNKALSRYFNYNNNRFLNNIKAEGFYIAENSFCNYGSTETSLSSSLNMQYHPHVFDVSLTRELIKNNSVFRFFSLHNYKIISINPWKVRATNRLMLPKIPWGIGYLQKLWQNALCTLNLIDIFIRTRTLFFYHDKIIFSFDRIIKKLHKKNIFAQLKRLSNTATLPGPKFIFCHILCPHEPFIFDAQGNNPKRTSTFKELYVEQLEFLNKQVYSVVKHILKKSSRKPIIIIQGDHGTRQTMPHDYIDKNTIHSSKFKRNFSILNAWYLPNKTNQVIKNLYSPISPANTFRVLLNHYFHTQLQILDDHSFTVGKVSGIHNFINIDAVLAKENDTYIDFAQLKKDNPTN